MSPNTLKIASKTNKITPVCPPPKHIVLPTLVVRNNSVGTVTGGDFMPKSRKRTSARTHKPTRSAANRPHHISVMERGPAGRFLVPASTGLETQLSLSAQ